MATLSEKIVQILTEAQSSVQCHQRLLKSLRALLDQHVDELEEFFATYFKLLRNALVVFKREPTVQRVIEFTAKFAISTGTILSSDDEENLDEPETSFFTLLLDKLLPLHEAQGKGVRFRVCQLVSQLLSLAQERGCVVGGRLELVSQVMLTRCLDKVSTVRVQAVSALQWLQSPDPDCPVVNLFLTLLTTDPSPEVRRCVLNRIQLDDRSLPAIIQRTRDVKEMIRRDAFLSLADKCSIRHFRIQQRIQLLDDGLRDDSEVVQEACVNGLLRKWSLETNDGDFIALLARLDVENSSKVSALALRKLFDNFTTQELISSMAQRLDPSHGHTPRPAHASSPPITASKRTSLPGEERSKVIPFEELGCEEVFYWSQLCYYLSERRVELDTILPTASEFCQYLHRYVEEVLTVQVDAQDCFKSEFVTQQLCGMLAVLDPSDEVGRRRVAELVTHFLSFPSFPVHLITHLVSQQTKIWPQESHRVEVFLEAIANLRASFNSGDSTLNLTTSFLSQPVSSSEPREDTETLLRCLVISCELLRELRPQQLSPSLQMLKDALLLPCVQHVEPNVRDLAVLGLGLLSLLNIATARDHLLLFIQASQVDHESVQATALKIVLDLLHVYGFEAFNIVSGDSDHTGIESPQREEDKGSPQKENVEAEEKDTMQRLLNILVRFLEGESSLLSQVAAEGIAKLLLSRRVLSQHLVAKLLILWYNPVLQDDRQLRATLGVFFPTFAASHRSCRECLGEVYLPVLTRVIDAPPTSPLYEIDVSNMADFLVHLTQPTEPNEESVHDNMAYAIANAVLLDPASQETRVYTRSLSQMTFSPTNQTNAKGLLELCDQMDSVVPDNTSRKHIDKLRKCLLKIAPSYYTANDTGPVRESIAGDEVPGEQMKSVQNTPLPLNQSRPNPKPRAVTTVKKRQRQAPAAKNKTNPKQKNAVNRRKKKLAKVPESSSEEESENENLEPLPASPPTVVAVRRGPKRAVAEKQKEEEAKQSLLFVSEDSEDSLVGDHSPFVKHSSSKTTRSRRLSSGPLIPLQLDDDS